MFALFCGCLGFWLGVGVGLFCFCFVFFDWRTSSVRYFKILRNCVLKYSWKHPQSGKTDEVRILKKALNLPTEYLIQARIFLEIKQILHTYGQEG